MFMVVLPQILRNFFNSISFPIFSSDQQQKLIETDKWLSIQIYQLVHENIYSSTVIICHFN